MHPEPGPLEPKSLAFSCCSIRIQLGCMPVAHSANQKSGCPEIPTPELPSTSETFAGSGAVQVRLGEKEGR